MSAQHQKQLNLANLIYGIICHSIGGDLRKGQKAELLFQEKLTSPKGLIRDAKISKVHDLKRYPSGVRYRLVLVNGLDGFVYLLYDNHWPKGDHVHIAGVEQNYIFESIDSLAKEFDRRSKEIEGKLNESNEDQN